jgi:hypothetical protein
MAVIALEISFFFYFLSSLAYADYCEGQKPEVVDDGRYRFSYESWSRKKYGKQFYGRCIKVVEPTKIMRADWVGVIPKGIIRSGRPLQSGVSFLTKENVDQFSVIYYGNSDDQKPNAYYISHASENAYGIEFKKNLEKALSDITKRLSDTKEFEIQSEARLSFYFYPNQNEYYLIDLNLSASSKIHYGGRYEFSFQYYLRSSNSNFLGNSLLIVPDNFLMKEALEESMDKEKIGLKIGHNQFTYSRNSDSKINFVHTGYTIYDNFGRIITRFPITSFIPKR